MAARSGRFRRIAQRNPRLSEAGSARGGWFPGALATGHTRRKTTLSLGVPSLQGSVRQTPNPALVGSPKGSTPGRKEMEPQR